MDMFLIKILAAFLALSQVTTRPDAINTRFDPVNDAAAVTRIMRDGCAQMRKAFDIEFDRHRRPDQDRDGRPRRLHGGDQGVARAEV